MSPRAPSVVQDNKPIDNHKCQLCDSILADHFSVVKHYLALHQLPLADALEKSKVLLAV